MFHQRNLQFSLQFNPNISGNLGLPNRHPTETNNWVPLSDMLTLHLPVSVYGARLQLHFVSLPQQVVGFPIDFIVNSNFSSRYHYMTKQLISKDKMSCLNSPNLYQEK